MRSQLVLIVDGKKWKPSHELFILSIDFIYPLSLQFAVIIQSSKLMCTPFSFQTTHFRCQCKSFLLFLPFTSRVFMSDSNKDPFMQNHHFNIVNKETFSSVCASLCHGYINRTIISSSRSTNAHLVQRKWPISLNN